MHDVHVNLDSRRTRSAIASCPPPQSSCVLPFDAYSQEALEDPIPASLPVLLYQAIENSTLAMLSTRQAGAGLQSSASPWPAARQKLTSQCRLLYGALPAPAFSKERAAFPTVINDRTGESSAKRTCMRACRKYKAPTSVKMSGVSRSILGARVNLKVLVDICSCPRVCLADNSQAISHSVLRENIFPV